MRGAKEEIISVRVPSELADAVRREAEREDRSLSGWVRHHIKRRTAEIGPRRELERGGDYVESLPESREV
ncbi:MAG: hypothetical protein KJO98_16600 [Rhodothermia bacterium]|nr:hypothetical protein [Rhodothermia bacterium]NNE33622.1 hypothetical protein [Rhodothermales bacterium]